MQKNIIRQILFTLVMASLMVYGMIVYNVSIHTGGLTNQTFLIALHELGIMLPIAFILEFFIVSKMAKTVAFKIVKPTDRPIFITFAISISICIIMCPTMSLIATLLFGEFSFATWIQTTAMNLPMALLWQLCYCGPLVRFIFSLFEAKKVTA